MKSAVFVFLVINFFILSVKGQNIDSLETIVSKTLGQEKIKILNTLTAHYCCRNGQKFQKYYTQTQNELDNTSYPLGKFLSLKHQGSYYSCMGQIDSAIMYHKIALGVSGISLAETSKVLYNIGATYRKQSKFDSAKKYLQIAVDQAEQVDLKIVLASAQNVYGLIFQREGKLDSALTRFIYAKNVADEIGHLQLKEVALANIGIIYFNHQSNLELGKKYLLEALEVATAINNSFSISRTLQQLGGVYFAMDSIELSRQYLEKSLKIARENNFQQHQLMCLQGLGNVYFKETNFKQALSINHQALKLSKNLNIPEETALLLNNIASNHFELGRYDSAKYYAEIAIESFNHIEKIGFHDQPYKYLAKSLYKLGNYKKAYDAHESYSARKDSILNIEKSRQLTEMETKYETDLKENEIRDLTQQASIRELEISQQRLIYGIAIALLIIIAVVIYLVFRINKSKSEQAAANLEQRLLRTQMNPHFIFNALGAIQNYMLKNDAQTAGIYLSKFSKLMRQILENSREEYISMSEEIEMLTNYLEVQQSRFQNSFEFDIQVSQDIDIENTTIPPMFAQPFLENAIEHGVSNLSEKGFINVAFSKNNNLINIEVADNGKGIESGTAQAKEHNSLATIITKERMAIFSKNIQQKLDLAIQNIKDTEGHIKGTQVKLNIPCIEN